jgi:predicted DNA-binding transcriptional regulator AlpA
MEETKERKERVVLLTASDVAEILCLSVRKIWEMDKQGQLPKPIRLAKKTVRWRESDIIDFLDNL